MTTIVQTNYKDRLVRGRPGMVADEAGLEVGTGICETSTGIPFGRAVSQGSAEKGKTLGGAAFVGVSLTDVTLNGVPLDPLNDGTPFAADIIGYRYNFGFASRGHIWVEAGMLVVPGNPLSYEQTYGKFSTGTGGTASHGKITFTKQPDPDETIDFHFGEASAVTWTFKASGANGTSESNIGATLNDTLVALAAALNASSETTLTKCKYLAYPTGGAEELHYAAEAAGDNNTWHVSTAIEGATVSPSQTALEGGSAAATAIVGGYWVSGAIAGEPAIISLGVQR